MYRPSLSELTITVFAGLLASTTLGMVLTVSADRSELVPNTPIASPVITVGDTQVSKYALPLPEPTPLDMQSVSTTSDFVSDSPALPKVLINSKTVLQTNTTQKIIPQPLKTTPKSLPNVSPNVGTSPVAFVDAFRQQVFELTNEFRISEGLPALKMNTVLTKNATVYSISMLKNRRLSHTDIRGCDLSCRFLRDKYSAQAWGENLAYYSFEDEPTVEEVAQFFMREWRKSAGHRANLVSPAFAQTGIGMAKNSTSIYVAVHFALP